MWAAIGLRLPLKLMDRHGSFPTYALHLCVCISPSRCDSRGLVEPDEIVRLCLSGLWEEMRAQEGENLASFSHPDPSANETMREPVVALSCWNAFTGFCLLRRAAVQVEAKI